MLYYKEYNGHDKVIYGKRKKFDNTVYTFDIETSNYLILNNQVIAGCDYEKLNEKEQKLAIKQSNMYIWQLSINDVVYYGRTWDELKDFLSKIEEIVPEKKYFFIHNLSFEFQFLKGEFSFDDVMARKSRKVISAILSNYNIEMRCSLMMSNCKLEKLPRVYQLPIEKKVGDLDYDKIRTSKTPLSDKEMGYCEYDCLVVYHFIKRELETYKTVDKIPRTSTGHVRRELKELIDKDYKYKAVVRKAISTDPHVYNLLVQTFAGGYTHANYIFTNEIIKNVISYDFTSSYPYIMVSHKFPAREFKKCNIKDINKLSDKFAYIIVLKMRNVKCKYFNNFISASKCRNIKGGKYDNGRIMSADEFEITITDIDLKIFLKAYLFDYEILEIYYSYYSYLPMKFINFILDKYVVKTKYKDVEDKKLEYQLEKGKFNALYGMSVTNTIRDKVLYDNEIGWEEIPLTNEEIKDSLEKEKKKAFLSFAYGVWVTAYARYNLLINIMKCDEYLVYADTDSMKLKEGYDPLVIERYNNQVKERIKYVSNILKIDISKYEPKDIYGVKHMLGLFEKDAEYEEFITQGAKKYAFKKDGKIEITVSGVPKDGAKALDSLDNFRDNFVFKHKDTNKNIIQYNDNQVPYIIKDYLGNEDVVKDKSGCIILPTSYELSKALEYANLISDNSSKRAIYKEVKND